MKVRILGGHNIETKETACISILIDNVLAIDAGALTANLSLKEQQNLKALLLSHQHYDHAKDIPLLGINFRLLEKSLEIYTSRQVHEALKTHLLDDVLYPDFTKEPPEKPALHFNIIEPGRTEQISGYSILPVKVNHAVPTSGFQITGPDGKKVFFTSDTGPVPEDCWQKVSPELLLIEVTLTNKDEKAALQAGHLTPALLQKEFESFCKIQGYLPQVVIVHMNPIVEPDLKNEIGRVEKALSVKIQFGYEGMEINI